MSDEVQYIIDYLESIAEVLTERIETAEMFLILDPYDASARFTAGGQEVGGFFKVQVPVFFFGQIIIKAFIKLFGFCLLYTSATRAASGRIMQVIAKHLPNMIGGSADLNASVKTFLNDLGVFQADTPEGNNIYFGIREHAMAAILSGLVLHGGLRAFGSTFMVFCDYMKPSIRLAALMGIPVTYVFSHDSIAVGEDGPTHQPIEHLSNLRSIPNLKVLRPADGRETAMAWLTAIKRKDGPCALILSRQNLPQLSGSGEGSLKGAYIPVSYTHLAAETVPQVTSLLRTEG